jgi:acylphosphatase
MLKIHAIVTGRVQAVFFRVTTAEKAKQIGVLGWVRNLSDGSVETEAYGSKEQLDHFLAYLHQGPPMARVDAVQHSIEPIEGKPPMEEFFVEQ